MEIAKRVYSLAQEQSDSALMIEAYRALGVTLCYFGDFESARQYTMRGIEIWRLERVLSPVEEVTAPAVSCLGHQALLEWHLGQVTECQATMAEGIALAKELNDMHALAVALWLAEFLGHFERDPAKVERLASDLIELSTRHQFVSWQAAGGVFRGWARSASGNTNEGIPWIEDGIAGWRATGWMLAVPYWLALKAEALHLADRTSEALDAIREAEAFAESHEERWWCAELYRLRGVFLKASGAEEAEIEASFCTAIATAKQQKSISLQTRSEMTYADYRFKKEERKFRNLTDRGHV
jgi:predicted ATPase